jgi:hypothetical protein
MDWAVTIHTPKVTDYDGMVYEDTTKHYFIPYNSRQDVYYAFKKRKKWVLKKRYVTGMWATNTYGVTLNDGDHIPADLFYRLFIDKNEAIEFCLKKNEQSKVKIYYN